MNVWGLAICKQIQGSQSCILLQASLRTIFVRWVIQARRRFNARLHSSIHITNNVLFQEYVKLKHEPHICCIIHVSIRLFFFYKHVLCFLKRTLKYLEYNSLRTSSKNYYQRCKILTNSTLPLTHCFIPKAYHRSIEQIAKKF